MARLTLPLALCLVATPLALADDSPLRRQAGVLRSNQSGPWSNPGTWQGGKVPGAGDRVLIREGHRVVYDVSSDQVLRVIHISGTLTFAPDRDTRLDVGLLRVQAG